MSDFKIQFEVFEGPMDLLLFLVKKQEVDIQSKNMGSKDLGLVTFYSNRLYYAASRLRFSLRSN